MTEPLDLLLMTAMMSPAAGGLAVSVPGMAHGLDTYDDLSVGVMGTLDPAAPDAAAGWGPRVHACGRRGPAALQYAPDMARRLEGLAPDIVDVQGLWTWTSRVSLMHYRRYRRPYIVTPRGMLDPWARRNSQWKKRLFGLFAENAHLRHAHCLRATAEMEAQHFRDMGLTNPVAIVANGIALPDLAPERPTALRQVLFLSRIHPKKGIDLLLNSWSVLAARFPGWEVVIAGIDENGHEAELKRAAAAMGLERVRFVGEKAGSEKQSLYRNADVFVLPTHAENFGLVVAEALAQGTPVITTTNAPWSGLRQHDCGWWIELSQERLTETMAAALSMAPGALAQMGLRGRDWVSAEFGFEQVAARMRQVYLWTAGRGPRPDFVHV